jgi:competence protein ComEC
MAAQHTTQLLPSDVLSLLFVASVCGLASKLLRWPATLCLGFVLLQVAGADVIGERLDPAYAGDSMLATVRVEEFPQRTGKATVMTLVPLADPRLPPRVRVSWHQPPIMPRIGEVWELELRLRRPRGRFNPGGFDRESWLFRERIQATGYVVAGKRNRLLWAGKVSSIDLFRARFVARASASAGSPETAAILAAVGVGARHLITREQWEQFAITGTTHLMAISGLHVGVAALTGFAIAFVIAAGFRGQVNHYLAAICCGALAAGAYALVSGLGVPAQRALLMLLLGAIAVTRRRQVYPATIVTLAAVVVYVCDPLSVLQPGFHLSFAAVILLLWLARRRIAARPRMFEAVRGLVVMQIFLMFGLLPLTVLTFGRFATMATPVNLVAVPVFSLGTVPLTLLGAALGDIWEAGSNLALRLAALGIAAVDALAGLAASWPGAHRTIAEVSGIAWLLLLLPLAWVLLPVSWPARRVALIGVLALVSWRPSAPPDDCFDAWVLDVGQGLAVALQTRRDLSLYDTGMAWRDGTTVAEQVILPFLASRGIRQVSRLVVSHADLDHSGGASLLDSRIPIAHLLAGEPLSGVDIRHCGQSEGWSSGGVRFEFLHPPRGLLLKGNDASCVLRVTAGRHSLLLTGDIERRGERELLRARYTLASDVVVVPHHGSSTSSSDPLVRAVSPAVAIVSAAHANRWGFPRAEVITRWQDAGARVLNTASHGAVGVRLCAGRGIVSLSSERQQRRRFWHAST